MDDPAHEPEFQAHASEHRPVDEVRASTAGTSINNLPTELLIIILDELQPIRSDLYNACLVDSRWCAIAQPLLFNVWCAHERYWCDQNKYALRYIRSLLDRPDLAASVNTICMDSCEGHNPEMEPQDPPPLDLLRRMLEAAERHRPGDEDWKTAISEGQHDAVLALMLYLLPRLHCLEFVMFYCEDPNLQCHWIANFAHQMSCQDSPATSPFLQNLRVIRAQNYTTECGFDMSVISPLLMLPNVLEVETYAMDCLWLSSDGTWPAMSSKARLLRLGHSGIEGRDFELLLGSFEALEVFEWQWGDFYVTEAYPDVWEIGDTLRRQGNFLQRLVIDVAGSFWSEHEDENIGNIGSLAQLTLLKSITIPTVFVTGRDDDYLDDEFEPPLPFMNVFPAALEELNLVDMTVALPQYLLHMARCCASKFPMLKVVRCPKWGPFDPEADIETIRQIFERAGVSLIEFRDVHLPHNFSCLL
ncbi:hypothetical protein F5Y16DRAFT_377923 [Xylariaceae sp. FL0255]|nr:hypothetical protein F5Y16DRAFT_377923 [Xylariaceae sp. FL0255]